MSPTIVEQYPAGRTIDDFRRKTRRPARMTADERALLRLLAPHLAELSVYPFPGFDPWSAGTPNMSTRTEED